MSKKLFGLIAFLVLVTSVISGCSSSSDRSSSSITKIGKGGYKTAPNLGDSHPPKAIYLSEQLKKVATPTNQWYSSVMYQKWSDNIYANPLSLKATEKGFEVSLPLKQIIPTDRKDVEVHYPHRKDIVIAPDAFKPESAILHDFSDWSVDIDLTAQSNYLRSTVGHGSPYVYFQLSTGNVTINLNNELTAEVLSHNSQILLIKNNKVHYAIFAPKNSKWANQSNIWTLELGEGARYFSFAVLPSNELKVINKYFDSAYAFVKDTKVTWQVDKLSREVTTHFVAKTQAMEQNQTTAILGLYPHHYHKNLSTPKEFISSIDSIRGSIKFIQSNQFSTNIAHHSFVPIWPKVLNKELASDLEKQLSRDSRRANKMMLEIGEGPYWQGKGLQRITQLMNVAQVQGDQKRAKKLSSLTKQRAEEWLSGEDRQRYFYYDKTSGTVVSYPEEYDAVKDMNDHHFHYGYWIRAAADIGLQDPNWIKNENWGSMINLLVEDIATTQRKSSRFPYLRNFDPYEGHSWASGVARGPDGNNQESTSEAMNAWAGLIMWGALQGKADLVDLGIYLYNTEIISTEYYWFDIYAQVFPEEYQKKYASIVFGAKLVHNTWWIDEPRQIHGINLLPMTPSSTYLGKDKNYIKINLKSLEESTEIYEGRLKKAKPADIWQDLFAKYLALSDPEAGLKLWDPWGSFELGDTRSHAIQWFATLNMYGTPIFSVQSDTLFYAVFEKEDKVRSYFVYNLDGDLKKVTFSDGFVLNAKPNTLTVATSK